MGSFSRGGIRTILWLLLKFRGAPLSDDEARELVSGSAIGDRRWVVVSDLARIDVALIGFGMAFERLCVPRREVK